MSQEQDFDNRVRDFPERMRWNEAILADQKLSAQAKVIATRLAFHMNTTSGLCYPSRKTLAKGSGCKEGAVKNALKQLGTSKNPAAFGVEAGVGGISG